MSLGTERLTTLAHDGLRFDVRDEGPVDGDVVVLLHGFPQRAGSWDGVAPLLHAAGLRTLAPDQRGYSPGARPRGRRPYRLAKLVGDVVALVERTGAPVHLVGHDWGAAVAWCVAASRPDLVRTLTAVSVPHPRAMVRALPRGQARASRYMLSFQLPWLPERVLSGRRSGAAKLGAAGMSPRMLETFRREIVAYGALRGGLGWYRALPFGSPGLLGRVRVPTTYVWSDGDVALLRVGADLTAAYVHADYELVVLEGVSHWIPDEQPAALAEAVLRRIVAD